MSLKSNFIMDEEEDRVIKTKPLKVKPVIKRSIKIPVQYKGGPRVIKTVSVDWICPVCGLPRGDPTSFNWVDAYGGSASCNSWSNPCGHVDSYSDVWIESQGLPSQKKTLANAIEPYYLWEERES